MSSTKTGEASGVDLITPRPEHVGELGRICYEAFKDIQDRHHFPLDFPNVAVARHVMGMLIGSPGFYGVAATIDGQLMGSNFLSLVDEVCGVGPITIDSSAQGRGVGRLLMQAVLNHAKEQNRARVRLVQESFNLTSLSLYASLGFDVKHPLALMSINPATEEDPTIRKVGAADLDAVDDLCRRIYKCSRRNEVAAAEALGSIAVLREREGELRGYYIPGLFGHGVAESEEDAVALIRQAARLAPPRLHLAFCPLTEGDLYRALLNASCRARKTATLMALGPYEPPEGVWMPSVSY